MANNKLPQNNKSLADRRKKYFIQMLDINRDTNMTRIYSAISQSPLLNPLPNKQSK